jgi:hypothetical protein
MLIVALILKTLGSILTNANCCALQKEWRSRLTVANSCVLTKKNNAVG